MPMEKDRRDRLASAEDAFARFLEAREESEASFESFCAAHPDLADELRRIRAGWQLADGLLEPSPPSGRERSSGEPVGPDFSGDQDRYEVLAELGRGGMGVVLRVQDRYLKRDLAMKVLRADRGTDRRAAVRFTEEAQVTSQLDHPSIVPIHDLGTLTDGRVFYTMPLVQGRDLGSIYALARDGADGWSLTRTLGVLLRVCEAVGAAHARGVVHRDLKPSNVMVGAHGEVYVMDWGLARIYGARARDEAIGQEDAPSSHRRELLDREPDSSVGTVDGQVLGTPAYMAPEQAAGGAATADARCDVYSAGAMLYELLTEGRPYSEPGETPDTGTVLERLLAGPPPAAHTRAPDAPAELVAICDRAMAREPADRYADMGELADDLRAYLERRVVSAYRTGAVAELVKWVQRNRALAMATAAGLLALVAGLISTAVLKNAADEEADRATAHFESALDAVDRMLTEVGFGKLADVPGAQSVRRTLLEDALEFYEGLLAESDEDLELRWRVAHARTRLTDVYALLEDYEAAVAQHAEGRAELARLREDDPDAMRAERVLALEAFDAANLHIGALEFELAHASVTEALERADVVLAARPEDTELECERASMYRLMGTVLHELGEPDAEEWILRSLDAYERFVSDGHYAQNRILIDNKFADALNYHAVFLSKAGRLARSSCTSRGSLRGRRAMCGERSSPARSRTSPSCWPGWRPGASRPRRPGAVPSPSRRSSPSTSPACPTTWT